MSKQVEKYSISLFENATSTNQTQLTVEKYFEAIVLGKWQDEVLQYRAGKFKKTDVHAVTASGLFLGRKDSELKEHSGLLVIDIDDKDQSQSVAEIRQSLPEIPELFALHSSLGGKGLAAYFRINRGKHFESFDAITKMLVNDYNIVPDMHCSNIGRLRFVSFDPDCYLNFGAPVWAYFEKKQNVASVGEQEYKNFVFSGSDVDYIIQQIKERQLNIAPDYYSWLRIGFGLADKFGESGRAYFKIISAYHPDKQRISIDKQFDRCLAGNRTGISIKSFFYYAKSAGCSLVSNRTSKIKTIGKIRRKQESQAGGGSIVNGKGDARKYLEEFEGITGKDVDEVLEQIWAMPESELAGESEGILHDIEIFLKSNYKFRLNEITNIVEVDGKPLNDYIGNSIYLQASRVVGDKVTKERVSDLIHSEFTAKYNPILEWFEKHKHIKTTGNIKKLAACIDSDIKYRDPDFIEYYLSKWLVSIIASAHGIYSIICLVLTGRVHGTGKTNFFRELLPDELQWLFVQNKLDGREADVAKIMCSKLLLLDDEFGGKSKSDEKKFKELISTQKFSVRMPYGRYFEDLMRLAVLCGTSNEEHILNDLTGNRRIIPIQVNSIDEIAYQKIDKTELFIELYWLYRENPKGWFLNKEDIERLNEVTFDSQQVAPEMELPLKYFERVTADNLPDPNAKFMSASEIRSAIEQRSGIRISQQKLSIALRNLKFEKDQKQIDGTRTRGFWVKDMFAQVPEMNNSDNTNGNKVSSVDQNPDLNTDELPF